MILIDKIMISCKQATYLHEKKKEVKLDGLEHLGLWIHLLYCKFCSRFIKQVELIEAATRKFYKQEESLHLPAERKEALKKAFEETLNK